MRPLPPDSPPPASPPKNPREKNAGAIAQHDLAVQLGVSLDDLKKLRDRALTQDLDWLPGRPILITPPGVQKIRAALALPVPATPSAAISSTDTPAAPQQPAVVRASLTVLRLAKGNTRIVLCKREDGTQVQLNTRSNAHFTPGMTVQNCVQRPTSPTLYDYEGRLPRRRGRF